MVVYHYVGVIRINEEDHFYIGCEQGVILIYADVTFNHFRESYNTY